ncbi:uncharacterized protein B0H18DRAFT_958529 [Fomitopsis serialis]|uniref:uncharacterized protein n=1 Tax=Fomitopsis serialis TaxID=139415 RepID=UPI0020079D9E|nr:uncharacterized protein B0H18DRAFT_958529 [Neoantrodia serialis]KAH9917084.1 hypothetical protein B0H18DRAFT_958529 [Neoantrodia serialis]
MFSKVVLALPLFGLVHARPFLHDRSYDEWAINNVRDDSTCAIVTVTVDEAATVTATGAVAAIAFAVGFDNRKETSFEPADLTSYPHIHVRPARQLLRRGRLAKQTCASAKAAADTVTAKTGGQADAFNAVFGIQTDFASVAAVNDQGVTQSAAASTAAAATTNVAIAKSSAAAAACAAPQTATVTVTVDATETATASVSVTSNVAVASAAAASSTASSSAIGNFGGRTETAFEPKDLTSYNHGSADNIAVITGFICNTLTNSCGADQTAKDTCQTAASAATAATPALSGAQADAFNAVFGVQTDFANVAQVSNTGATLGAAGASAAAAATSNVAVAVPATSAAATGSSTASSSAIGNFGSCSVPEIVFATGLDGRKETAFEPKDLTSYAHDSAQNIDIITKFMCDTLTNSCGADATAKSTCASAITAADQQTAKTGAQADAFNAVFGIQTDFANVAAVNDQGVTQGASGAASTKLLPPLRLLLPLQSRRRAQGCHYGRCHRDLCCCCRDLCRPPPPLLLQPRLHGFLEWHRQLWLVSVPEIVFAQGLDNRKETAFEPKDLTSYAHIHVRHAHELVRRRRHRKGDLCVRHCAADKQTAKTGAQADAFNAVFGIQTNFANVLS